MQFLPMPAAAASPFLPITLFASTVQAGFPSPADDYAEQHLDLNRYLVDSPASTYFFRARETIKEEDIQQDDLLVIDRSLALASGRLVIAIINEEFVIRRIKKQGRHLYLTMEGKQENLLNDTSSPSQVWGVITSIIRHV